MRAKIEWCNSWRKVNIFWAIVNQSKAVSWNKWNIPFNSFLVNKLFVIIKCRAEEEEKKMTRRIRRGGEGRRRGGEDDDDYDDEEE